MTRYGALFVLIASTFLAACASAPPSPPATAEERDREISRIVDAAETMFKAMKARDHRGIWRTLSARSRETIVAETVDALKKAGPGEFGTAPGTPPGAAPGTAAGAGEVRADLAGGGPVAAAYWDAFLTHFDPDTALAASRWEMGETAGDRATIRITYKTSERPAVLEMFREEGAWKVGLVETFWGRK